MFVKALFDVSDKYNISVLDIINNTYNIPDIYNEPVLKSNSDSVGVKLIYNPDDKGMVGLKVCTKFELENEWMNKSL